MCIRYNCWIICHTVMYADLSFIHLLIFMLFPLFFLYDIRHTDLSLLAFLMDMHILCQLRCIFVWYTIGWKLAGNTSFTMAVENWFWLSFIMTHERVLKGILQMFHRQIDGNLNLGTHTLRILRFLKNISSLHQIVMLEKIVEM